MPQLKLTHTTDKGIKMVEISQKRDVARTAKASGRIYLKKETIKLIREGRLEKGNVLTTAQVAATLAVKRTPDLIPLCHLIMITGVEVDFRFHEDYIEVLLEARTVGKTGIEMEAVTGVSIALLTIWDMVKVVEKDDKGQYPVTRISDIRVTEKIKEG